MPLHKARRKTKKAISRAVGKNMRELKKAHPRWSQKRRLAASLHAAGAPRKRKKSRKGR